jgi:hypothetical protein
VRAPLSLSFSFPYYPLGANRYQQTNRRAPSATPHFAASSSSLPLGLGRSFVDSYLQGGGILIVSLVPLKTLHVSRTSDLSQRERESYRGGGNAVVLSVEASGDVEPASALNRKWCTCWESNHSNPPVVCGQQAHAPASNAHTLSSAPLSSVTPFWSSSPSASCSLPPIHPTLRDRQADRRTAPAYPIDCPSSARTERRRVPHSSTVIVVGKDEARRDAQTPWCASQPACLLSEPVSVRVSSSSLIYASSFFHIVVVVVVVALSFTFANSSIIPLSTTLQPPLSLISHHGRANRNRSWSRHRAARPAEAAPSTKPPPSQDILVAHSFTATTA